MKKIHDTLTICEVCYRHVPGTLFERDNQIWLTKTCKEHGTVEHLVEPDSTFYNEYTYEPRRLDGYLIEVTNRCNLDCPHCYQLPDSNSLDPDIDYVLDIIKSWPDDGRHVVLAGAEPTVRKDLPELMRSIRQLPGKHRRLMVLTNGVNFHRDDYAEQFVDIPDLQWTVGLNHPDYQGPVVHRKQLEGIKNIKKAGLHLKNISYTLESLDQLEYVLDEIMEFKDTVKQYRIRCGADIGRYPGDPKLYMSQLVSEVKKLCERKSWSFERMHPSEGNRSHYPAKINNVPVKIIQWPDAKTIDLKEMQTEILADIVPNKPPSPLLHQVIIRDGAVNKKLMLYDTIPQEYIDNYGFNRD